jgi:hypothetical protein
MISEYHIRLLERAVWQGTGGILDGPLSWPIDKDRQNAENRQRRHPRIQR